MLQGDSVNGPRADAKEMYGKGKADGMDRWYLDVRWYDLGGGGGYAVAHLLSKFGVQLWNYRGKATDGRHRPVGIYSFVIGQQDARSTAESWNRAKAADGRYHTWGVTILRFVSNLQHLGKSPFVAIMNVMILTMRFRKSGRVFRQA